MDKKTNNNPFRKEAKKVSDWGGDTGDRVDRNKKKSGWGREGGRVEKTKKELNWGKVKFNPVAKTAATENATPWSHFKNEIMQKQQDDAAHVTKDNSNNANAKESFKKREENYRRNLIDSKRNEPTQWEDFSDETPGTSKSKKKSKEEVKGRFQKIPSNIKNLESISKEDFDSKKLTPQQNNFLKKVITKQTMKRKGSFKQAISDLKFRGVKRKAMNE